MPGVYATPVGERVYAASGGAERIIGHADSQGAGVDGIELVLDSLLRGTKGTVSMVKSCGSAYGTSSQVSGVDTGAQGSPRSEYALRMVRSRAFWL